MKPINTDIIAEIKAAKTVAIMGHNKGDGDSFGAMCALFLGLTQIGKKVAIYSDTDLPKNLDFLRNFIDFRYTNEFTDTDILIIVDCGSSQQCSLPKVLEMYRLHKKVVIAFDHHQIGDISEIATLSQVDESYAATCEIIYSLQNDLGINIDKNIATCLLTGVETDTSSFQNQNTSKEIFDLASILLGKGARLNTIVSKNINSFSVGSLKLFGLAIDRMHYDEETGIASTYLTFEDAKRFDATTNDFELIVNNLNQIRGAKLIVFYKQEKPGEVKVSLRTRDNKVDVAKIAKEFGGGGHEKAAAFALSGDIVIRDGKIVVEK